MKFIDYLKIIIHSFYSSKLYKYIYNSWNGNIFAYYFILSFFLCLPPFIEKFYIFSQINPEAISSEQEQTGLNQGLQFIWQQIPPLIIRNGELEYKEDSKKIINSPQGTPLIVFDQDQKLKDSLPADAHPELLNFGKYGIFIRPLNQGNGSFIEYKDIPLFQGTEQVEVDKYSLLSVIKAVKEKFMLISFLFALGLAWSIIISTSLFTAFYCLVVKFAFTFKKENLETKNLYALALISQTPALLVKSIAGTDIVNFYFPAMASLGLILGIWYLIFALRAAVAKAV